MGSSHRSPPAPDGAARQKTLHSGWCGSAASSAVDDALAERACDRAFPAGRGRWEFQHEGRAFGGFGELDHSAILLGELARDGEAETAAGRPGPSSAIRTTTVAPARSTEMSTVFSELRRRATPTALWSRLNMMRKSCSASAKAGKAPCAWTRISKRAGATGSSSAATWRIVFTTSTSRRACGSARADWVSACSHMELARVINAWAASTAFWPPEPASRSSVSRCKPTVASVLRMSCAHLVAGEGGVRKLGQTKASCGMAVVLYSGADVAPTANITMRRAIAANTDALSI